MSKNVYRVPGEVPLQEVAKSMKEQTSPSLGEVIGFGCGLVFAGVLLFFGLNCLIPTPPPIKEPTVQSTCVNMATTRTDVQCDKDQKVRFWFDAWSENMEIVSCACKHMPPKQENCREHIIPRDSLRGDMTCELGQTLYIGEISIICACP